MKTKKQIFTLITLMALGISAGCLFSQDKTGQIFERAIFLEESEGDLQKAIDLYRQILVKHSQNREIAAKAQLHIGLCYEKLGKVEAVKAYEAVVQKYAEQHEQVSVAQKRLAELKKDESKGLTVVKMFPEDAMLEGAVLSSDGTKVTGITYKEGQNVTIYDRMTNESKLFTKVSWEEGWTYFPVWSPDGTEIAYEVGVNARGTCELRAQTMDGNTRVLLTNPPNSGQIVPRQWVKDGSAILAFRQDTTGFYTIGLVPIAGGSFKALHQTQWYSRMPGDASISPDGRFIVFADGPEDSLDLYIISAKGGKPSVLSDHPANEYTALWSPDGQYIVFMRRTHGGSLLYGQKMEDGNPVGQPFLIKDGLQGVDLMNWTEHGIGYISWIDLRDIYTLPLNPETGEPVGDPRILYYRPTGSSYNPVWSHDGKYLAFASYADKPEIVIMELDGSTTRHFPIPARDFRIPFLFDLRWLPDNSGVGFNNYGNLGRSTLYKLDIASGEWQEWLIPVHGWTRTDWGPDENSFVFATWNEKEPGAVLPDPGLHQYNIETGETRHIYKQTVGDARNIRGIKFSRDFKKLGFSEWGQLMVLDIESGESRALGERLGYPAFSPNGKTIIAIGEVGEGNDRKFFLAVLNLEGNILHQYDLSKHFSPKTRFSCLDWSPDGKKLVFHARSITYESYLMKNVIQ